MKKASLFDILPDQDRFNGTVGRNWFISIEPTCTFVSGESIARFCVAQAEMGAFSETAPGKSLRLILAVSGLPCPPENCLDGDSVIAHYTDRQHEEAEANDPHVL